MTGRKNARKTKQNMYKNYTNSDLICGDPGVMFVCFFLLTSKTAMVTIILKRTKKKKGCKKKKEKRPKISHSYQKKYHIHYKMKKKDYK